MLAENFAEQGGGRRNTDVFRGRQRSYAEFYATDVKVFYLMIVLYQYPVAMIDLVLDDLRGKACVGLCFPLKAAVLIFDLDRIIPCGFARRSDERQTALFGLIRRGFRDDLGVVHHGVSAAVVERYNTHGFADHIRRHTHAGLTVRHESVEQITRNGSVLLQGGF